MLSRKYYKALADCIRIVLIDYRQPSPEADAVAHVARLIARECKADNSRFSYDRFYSACGLDHVGECLPTSPRALAINDSPVPMDSQSTIERLIARGAL